MYDYDEVLFGKITCLHLNQFHGHHIQYENFISWWFLDKNPLTDADKVLKYVHGCHQGGDLQGKAVHPGT